MRDILLATCVSAGLLFGCGPSQSSTRPPVVDAGTSQDAEHDGAPVPDVSDDADMPADVSYDLPVAADIIVSVPDVSIAKQPLGGVCTSDEDCIDGWCNTNYTGGYCSLECSSSADCPAGGPCYSDPTGGGKMCWKPCQFPNQCRPDQFCAQGANICTPKCVPGSCSQGYECNQGTGECNPIGSVTCSPSAEVCDDQDNDCDAVVDEGCGPAIAAHGNYIITDLGKVVAGDDGLSQVLEFDISSGSKGFQIILVKNDDSDAYLGIFQLQGPSGELLVSGLNPYEHLNRSWPGYGIATTQVPITPDYDFETGTYSMSVYRSGPLGEIWAYVVQSVRSNVATSKIDMNFWFVGTPINASNAGSNNKFQNLVGEFANLLNDHGIGIGELNYYDVTGDDAQKYAVIDANSGQGVDEQGELLRLTSSLPSTNKGMNFFFVQGFTGWGLLGRAGGIPGPAMQGTSDSGVVVSLADYYELPSQVGVSLTARTMVHEMGHQLGLSHTTEQSLTAEYGWLHDPIADTPQCQNDINSDGIVDGGECIGSGRYHPQTDSRTALTGIRSLIGFGNLVGPLVQSVLYLRW